MASKARFELRFDGDLYAEVKDLAARAGLSVNQLMQGITAWAIENAHAGLPYPGEQGSIETDDVEEVLWFGDDGLSDPERPSKGKYYFVLDFRPGNAVRDMEDYLE